MGGGGIGWDGFEHAAPDLAARVRARLESHRHGVLATVRADGSPRLSGLELPIRSGHLWLAMMTGSRKADDLLRDPRFAVHSAPDAEDLPDGDASVNGVAAPAAPEERAEFIAGHRFPIEDPSDMALFVGLIRRAVLARVEGDEMVIESWTPAGGHVTRRRR